MPAEGIHINALGVDLSPRFVSSSVVAASPALAAETTICTITIPANAAVTSGIQLSGWAAFTVGTSGSACTLKIRQTSTAGTTIASTGATTGGIAAASLVDMNVQGLDTAGVLPGQVYVLTLTVTAGAAASTVSACQLTALVI
jgi:hypothetical protein